MLVLVLPPSLELLLLELELLPKPKLQLPAKAPVDHAAALKIVRTKTNFLMTLSFGFVTARAPPGLSASMVRDIFSSFAGFVKKSSSRGGATKRFAEHCLGAETGARAAPNSAYPV